jgi:hypothetical protein
MIDWQTRGNGPLEHRYHRLTPAQVAAVEVPATAGMHALLVDGEQVFGLFVPTTWLPGRPLRMSPVVYPTALVCEAHAEAWLTRDRDVFYAGREG